MAIPRINWSKLKDKPESNISGREALITWLLVVFSMILGIILGAMGAANIIEKSPETVYIKQHKPDHKALNQENVLYWLNYFEVQYPEIVLAQSIQECGWKYDSYRAETYNNIFGFETGAGALSFGHWVGSVIYYKKWQDTYYPGGDYLEFLESYGYAADTLYTVKVKQIVSLIEAE